MKNFFAEEGAKLALIKDAYSWLGTPFRDHGRTRGGVDCLGLAIALHVQAGTVQPFDFTAYSLDGGYHRKDNPVQEWLETSGRFVKTWERPEKVTTAPELEPGQILTMKIGRIPFHMGVAISSKDFIHAHPSAGVIEADVQDWTYLKRLQAIYTPITL